MITSWTRTRGGSGAGVPYSVSEVRDLVYDMSMLIDGTAEKRLG